MAGIRVGRWALVPSAATPPTCKQDDAHVADNEYNAPTATVRAGAPAGPRQEHRPQAPQ
jgi:hypothetical protein